jgi:long-chain acyl-CoA synthetase
MTCNFTIYDMMARNADLYPESVAIVDGGRRITYQDFRRQCDGCAAGLSSAGFAAGDRIAVISGNSLDFMVLFGAAAKIGAVVVPVNTRLGDEEIAYILQDAGPVCLVSDKAYRATAERAAARMNSAIKYYFFDDAPSESVCFRTLLRQEGGDAQDALSGEISGDAPLLIIHTAAVGGRPRGSILSQANLLAGGMQLVHLLQLGERDAYLGLLPLFHIGGLVMTVATMLAAGKTVLMERFDPAAATGLIHSENITFFVSFPPMLAAVLDAGEKAAPDASSLRAVCGVDGPETIERFLKAHSGATFYSLYGQTEAMPVSGGDHRKRPGSIGRPTILTHIALLDDLDRPVPAETPGEICVRSPAVFLGYWNLPEETVRTSRGGWHHTGDLGRVDAEGFLWYGGRKPEKELIKTGGENVYPAEVEKALLAHDAVREACVFGVPDAQWGEAVKAVCVLRQGVTVSATELMDFAAAAIARYKKPKQIVFVDELPKTTGGAVDRAQVRKIWGAPS